MILTYIVKDNKYMAIKDVLRQYFDMSQRFIRKLKVNKKITLNGNISFFDQKLNINDIIEININFNDNETSVVPTQIDLNIIYEDDALLVINKQPKMTVHPSPNHFSTSLSNGVKFYYNNKGINSKIHLVNRLDKDTSGLVIFAKNEYIQETLVKQMKTKDFYKEYYAIVEGNLEKHSGVINAPIARKNGSIIEREVNPNGEIAITHYTVLEHLDSDNTLVKFVLETGRTHQIRVHSKHIGHSILGDTLYGTKSELITRQALHSYITKFTHPITKKEIEFMAPIPNDIEEVLKCKSIKKQKR